MATLADNYVTDYAACFFTKLVSK